MTDNYGNATGPLPQATVELAAQTGAEMGLYGAAGPDLDVRALARAVGLR
jgi:hypothetical protein